MLENSKALDSISDVELIDSPSDPICLLTQHPCGKNVSLRIVLSQILSI